MNRPETMPGRFWLKTAADRLLDLVYPQNLYCICCEDTMQQNRIHGICDNCAEKMEWLSHNPLRSRMDELAFDELYSCCVYGFYARKIIHGLKLHNKTYIAKNVGLLMAEKLKLETAEISVKTDSSVSDGIYAGAGASESNKERARQLKAHYEVLVPVPSSRKKLKQRGYNQAEMLARYIGAELSLPVWSNVLLKTSETASMRLASGNERRNMLQGAFSLSENACEMLQNKDIILVDDVVTTGSTADACAMTLKDGGARTVAVLCFASGSGYASDRELEARIS